MPRVTIARLVSALLAAACLAAPRAPAQSNVILLPHWQPEQVRRLEMVTETKRLTGLRESLIRRVRRLTDLRITSVDAQRILLTWTDRDYEVTTAQGKVSDPPIEAFKNEPIEITLNGRGQIGEIRNWETLRRLILKAQDRLDAGAKQAGRSEEQIQQSRAALEQSLASEEAVRAAWANREGTYFYFYGLSVPVEAGLKSEQEFTLPVSGARMPCQARLTAEFVGNSRDRVKFHFEKLVDLAQAASRVQVALQELSRQSGRDATKVPLPQVELVDRMEAEADLLSGWVLSLNQYRKAVVSGTPVAQIETVTFTLQDRRGP